MTDITNETVLKNNRFFALLVEVADIILLNIYTAVFIWICFNLQQSHTGFFLATNLAYIISVSLAAPIAHVKHISNMSVLRRATRIWILFTILSVLLYLFLDVSNVRYWLQGIFYYGIYLLILNGSELVLHAFLRDLRSHMLQSSSIFMGNEPALEKLVEGMKHDYGNSYNIKGYFADEEKKGFADNAFPYLGKLEDVFSWLDENPVDEIYCCLPPSHSDFANKALEYCDSNVIKFFAVPILISAVERNLQTSLMGDIPIMHVRNMPLTQIENRLKKRFLDIVISSLVLILVLSWLTPIVALIIKITMPGPIFFKQKRTGLDGKEFMLYKYRSMKVNKQADTLQATKDDPRKTKFGNFIRHYNIDELPQFWNVFKGEMSVVGPRPHMVIQTEEFSRLIPKYMVRHFAKPGITGWAQVTGFRGETSELWQMEGRVRKDIWYIEHWSVWLDIKIIWLTVRNTFSGHDKNAY